MVDNGVASVKFYGTPTMLLLSANSWDSQVKVHMYALSGLDNLLNTC